MDLDLSLFMTQTSTWKMKHQSKRSFDYEIVIYLMLFRNRVQEEYAHFFPPNVCLKSCFNVSIILPACLHHPKPRAYEWFDKCGDTFKTWVLIICTEIRVAKFSSYNGYYASAKTSIWTCSESCVQASAFRTSQTCLRWSLLWSIYHYIF